MLLLSLKNLCLSNNYLPSKIGISGSLKPACISYTPAAVITLSVFLTASGHLRGEALPLVSAPCRQAVVYERLLHICTGLSTPPPWATHRRE